jgi:hypothetical protein
MRTTSTLAVALAIALTATAGAGAFGFFQSPSGNIGCAISRHDGVRCDIREHDWTAPPKPAWCDLDWGSGVVVGRHGRAQIVCAGDTTLGAGRRLAYGDAIARGRFRCVSRRRGMRCVNRRNDHGFALSRQRARRF